MIFVIGDDNVLSILRDIDEANGACEGIDVEEGTFQFFDHSGRPLEPEFVTPNERGRFSVLSGRYELKTSTNNERSKLIDLLDNLSGFEPNEEYEDLDAVRRMLKRTSS